MTYETRIKRSLRLGAFLAASLAAGSTNALFGQDRAARVREVYAPEAAAQIEAIVEAARSNGVPAGPLYDRALEGAEHSQRSALLHRTELVRLLTRGLRALEHA